MIMVHWNDLIFITNLEGKDSYAHHSDDKTEKHGGSQSKIKLNHMLNSYMFLLFHTTAGRQNKKAEVIYL